MPPGPAQSTRSGRRKRTHRKHRSVVSPCYGEHLCLEVLDTYSTPLAASGMLDDAGSASAFVLAGDAESAPIDFNPNLDS